MYNEEPKEYEDCIPLSQSKYILAKYRIQVTDKPKESLGDDLFDIKESTGSAIKEGQHTHLGPKAIDPNLHGGEFGCNYETFCQLLWCFCVPCYSAHVCWIRCCEMCYDNCSKYITEKEEVSTMSFCTMDCCRI